MSTLFEALVSSEDSIVRKTLEAGADYCDLRIESVIGTGIEVKDAELRRIVPGRNGGALLRALVDGSWGIMSFNEESSMDTAPELAVRLARVSGKGDVVLADHPPITKRIDWKPGIDPQDIGLEEKCSLLREVNSRVIGKEGIQGITSAYQDSTITKRLVTSEGTETQYTLCVGHIQSSIIAKRDGRIMGYRTRVGATGGYEIFGDDDPVEKAEEGADTALEVLGARSSPSGRMKVITDNDLTGVFAHEAIGHATEADHVVSGESILRGQIGEVVACDQVTLVDDATIPGGFGSFPIDDEGIPSERKVLIEDGVLTGYIHNRETAGKLGMRPNGGARGQSYSSTPLVRMSNTMITAGDLSFEELIEPIEYGVYAKGTRGGQVDTVRGSFQFSAQQAFLIEKGELTVRLRDVSLSGMTMEIMRNIGGVGKDERLGDPGFCGKGQMVPVGDGGPHLRIRNAVVGGGA
jgi:TldD protein